MRTSIQEVKLPARLLFRAQCAETGEVHECPGIVPILRVIGQAASYLADSHSTEQASTWQITNTWQITIIDNPAFVVVNP